MEIRNDSVRQSQASRESRMSRIILIGVCAVVVLSAAIWGYMYVSGGYDGEEPQRLYIRKGTDDENLRDYLESQLGGYGVRVYTLWSMMGHAMPHGSYVVSPDMSAFKAARMIALGRQTPVRLTFNNLRTMSQLAQRVSNVMECDSLSFLRSADSIAQARGYSRYEVPAVFLPDSYEFYWTASPAAIVENLVDVRDRFWNDSRSAKARAIGLTPAQVATVASIVEEETAKADERPLVARLYLNRLEKGMPLQADPTVKFSLGEFGLRRITGAHLKVESPYNTYKYKGLPPGPIRIADRSAIDDVLDAPHHNYIYMCAKEDFSGYHNFATDYASHTNNARRYRQALDRRGIK